MTKRLKIFGRAIPVWLLILTLVVAGAGAAVGTVLAGQIGGEVPVTVSQALTLDTDDPPDVTGADQAFTSVSDDGTGFTAAIETNTGDDVTITLYPVNHSDEALVAELTLILPDGFTASVAGSTHVTNVTRTGLYTWIMDMDTSVAGKGTDSDLVVTLALADDIDPGFYTIEGTLKQVAY
jgi:hypothetical protein